MARVSRTKLDGSHVPSHGILGDGVLSLAQARSQTPYDERKLKDEVPATVGNMYCGLEMQIFLLLGIQYMDSASVADESERRL